MVHHINKEKNTVTSRVHDGRS